MYIATNRKNSKTIGLMKEMQKLCVSSSKHEICKFIEFGKVLIYDATKPNYFYIDVRFRGICLTVSSMFLELKVPLTVALYKTKITQWLEDAIQEVKDNL